jgi:hypothetical protein
MRRESASPNRQPRTFRRTAEDTKGQRCLSVHSPAHEQLAMQGEGCWRFEGQRSALCKRAQVSNVPPYVYEMTQSDLKPKEMTR